MSFDEAQFVKNHLSHLSVPSLQSSTNSQIPSAITTVPSPSISATHPLPPVILPIPEADTSIPISFPDSLSPQNSLQNSFTPDSLISLEASPSHSDHIDDQIPNSSPVPTTNQDTGHIPIPATLTDDPYDFSLSSHTDTPVLSQTVPESSTTNSVEASSSSTMSRREVHPPIRYGDWYYAFSAMAGTLPPVPKSYKEALQSPCATQWRAAMDEEFNSLITNKTWRLTTLPPGRKAIRCKWVYALKTKPDGSLDRFKARLVAKGCSQIPGVDFHETFSPTVKYDSLRIILALVASLNLHMQQFDIKTAFLYGSIQEELYMEQVEGYVDQTWIEAVCLLLQALYGLRQSSRAWSKKMEGFLKAFGLIQAVVDHCVYYSH